MAGPTKADRGVPVPEVRLIPSSFDQNRLGGTSLEVAEHCVGGVIETVDVCGDEFGM